MSKKNKGGFVYSTNPDFAMNNDVEKAETLPASEQKLTISRSSKGRGGKTVTLIEGLIGTDDDLTELGRLLKNKVGTGGSAKEGEILIQGDHRQKVAEILKAEGYKVKLSGG